MVCMSPCCTERNAELGEGGMGHDGRDLTAMCGLLRHKELNMWGAQWMHADNLHHKIHPLKILWICAPLSVNFKASWTRQLCKKHLEVLSGDGTCCVHVGASQLFSQWLSQVVSTELVVFAKGRQAMMGEKGGKYFKHELSRQEQISKQKCSPIPVGRKSFPSKCSKGDRMPLRKIQPPPLKKKKRT